MNLRNKTNSLILVEHADLTKNMWQRMQGLLGKKIYLNRALIIRPCNQVHTWFMRFSIDVLFIDHQNRVIAKELDLKPWAISKKQPKAVAVIEAAAGVFLDEKVCIGDLLEFEKVDIDEGINRINDYK